MLNIRLFYDPGKQNTGNILRQMIANIYLRCLVLSLIYSRVIIELEGIEGIMTMLSTKQLTLRRYADRNIKI